MTANDLPKKPPFIDNDNGLDAQAIDRFLLSIDLDETEREFVINLMSWCNSQDQPLSLYVIAPRTALTVVGLRKRLEKLTDKSVFKKHKVRAPNSGRTAVLYRFHCAQPATTVPQKPTYATLESGSFNKISSPRQELFMKAKMDNLFHTVLFAAVPAKLSKKSLAKPIRGHINWFETQVATTTRTLSGYPPFRPRDMLYLEAIYGITQELINTEIRNGRTPYNLFVVNISTIHDLMDIPLEGGHLETTVNCLNRLSGTAIDVHDLPDKIKNYYGGITSKGMERFIALNNYGLYYDYEGGRLTKPKICAKFSLDEISFLMQTSEDHYLFDVNPKIFKETSDVLIAFHFWCRRRIGVKGTTIGTTLKRLHLDVSPLLTYREFLDGLFGGLRKRFQSHISSAELDETVSSTVSPTKSLPFGNKDELILKDKKVIKHNEIQRCSINVVGYRLVLNENGQVYVVPVVDDPFVGVASRHRQALRRKGSQGFDISNHPGLHDKEHEDDLFDMVQNDLEF